MSEEHSDTETNSASWGQDLSKKSRSPPRAYQHERSYTNSSRREYDSGHGQRGRQRGEGSWRSDDRGGRDDDRGGRNDDRGGRSDDRGGRNDNYSRRSDKCSEKIEINSGQVGMVIGKGGSNIRNIESKYSVSVKVDKNSGGYEMSSVAIYGDTKSDVDDAVNHIRDQLENSQQRSYGGERRRDY